MVEYLRKIYDFFKTSEIAKDLFLGSIGAAVGVFVVNILVKRRNDWISRYCNVDIYLINCHIFSEKNNQFMSRCWAIETIIYNFSNSVFVGTVPV